MAMEMTKAYADFVADLLFRGLRALERQLR
jgi:hypothetical protein